MAGKIGAGLFADAIGNAITQAQVDKQQNLKDIMQMRLQQQQLAGGRQQQQQSAQAFPLQQRQLVEMLQQARQKQQLAEQEAARKAALLPYEQGLYESQAKHEMTPPYHAPTHFTDPNTGATTILYPDGRREVIQPGKSPDQVRQDNASAAISAARQKKGSALSPKELLDTVTPFLTPDEARKAAADELKAEAKRQADQQKEALAQNKVQEKDAEKDKKERAKDLVKINASAERAVLDAIKNPSGFGKVGIGKTFEEQAQSKRFLLDYYRRMIAATEYGIQLPGVPLEPPAHLKGQWSSEPASTGGHWYSGLSSWIPSLKSLTASSPSAQQAGSPTGKKDPKAALAGIISDLNAKKTMTEEDILKRLTDSGMTAEGAKAVLADLKRKY